MDVSRNLSRPASRAGAASDQMSKASAGTILIIEDEEDILELVQYNLERQGYRVIGAANGEEGLALAQKVRPDLILLDIMMPGIDGITVCRRLRENVETRQLPVMMLTAKSEESDIVIGLELGADDYVTKPFSPRELVARVKAVLRRSDGAQGDASAQAVLIKAGPIEIDDARHEVFHHGAPLQLTLAEYKLLHTLVTKPGRVFSRDQLLEKITGGDTYVIDRNVDVHVRAIRRKLVDDADFIQTVRGVGYKCKE